MNFKLKIIANILGVTSEFFEVAESLYNIFPNGTLQDIDTEAILRSRGLKYGTYTVIYYIISPIPNIVTSLLYQVSSINHSGIQFSATTNIDKSQLQTLRQYQEYYNKNKIKIKYIMLNADRNKHAIINTFKFNYFTNKIFFRSEQKSQFVLNQTLTIHELLYQPLSIQCHIQFHQQNDVLQSFSPPKRIQVYHHNNALEDQTIQSILGSRGDHPLLSPLTIININDNNGYNCDQLSNFIHFGSNLSRFSTFLNKYAQISTSINSLNNQNYTYSAQYRRNLISNIISNFTPYENELFHRVVGYQNISNSIISDLDPQWVDSMSIAARQYDSNNIHSLINFIPENIKAQPKNEDLISMVYLIGDVYDEYWSSIKNISALSDTKQQNLIKYSTPFLRQLLANSSGIDVYSPFAISNLYDAYRSTLLFDNPGSTISQLSVNQYQKVLLSRLISQMPTLLRTKGTRASLQQLLHIYGLSTDLISIKQVNNNIEQPGIITQGYYNGLTSTSSDQILTITHTPSLLDVSNAIIIDFKYNSIESGDLLTYPVTIKYTDINSKYCSEPLQLVLYNDQSAIIKIYHDKIPIYESTSISDTNTIKMSGYTTIDSIKIVSSSTWKNSSIPYYISGVNYIESRDDLKVYYDFNVTDSAIISNNEFTIVYDSNNVDRSYMKRYMYSSVFDNYESCKFYSVGGTQSSAANNTDSSVIIGVKYNDQYNKSLTHQRIGGLVDSIYQNSNRSYYCNDRIGSIQSTYNTYDTLVKFYQNIDDTVIRTLKEFIPVTVKSKCGLILENPLSYKNVIPSIEYTSTNITPYVSDDINVAQYITLKNTKVQPALTDRGFQTIGQVKPYISPSVVAKQYINFINIKSSTLISKKCKRLHIIDDMLSVRGSSILPISSIIKLNIFQNKIHTTCNYNMSVREYTVNDLYRVGYDSDYGINISRPRDQIQINDNSRSKLPMYPLIRTSRTGQIESSIKVNERKLIINKQGTLESTKLFIV